MRTLTETLITIMKFLFGTIFALLLSSQAIAQNMDDGFSPLSLFAPTENIQGLEPIALEDLWSPYQESDWFTTTYATLDVKNLKNNDFFGLSVDRAEVIMTEGESEEGESLMEIREFTLLIEDPGTEAYNEFMDKVESAFGPIFTFSIHEDDTESPNWFSDVTLLTISGADHRIEHGGKKYIMVYFMSAVGG
jgi:hypothetical protein